MADNKYSEISSMLSEEQKIALVADLGCAANDAFNALGVPHAERASLDALNGEYGGAAECPDFSSLTASWNLKLIEQAAGDAALRADTKRFDLISLPQSALRTGARAVGMSEDPYLNAKAIDACVSALESSGAAACLTGCGVRAIDVEYTDADVDPRLLGNVLVRSVDAVLRTKKPAAAEFSLARLRGGYKDINARIMSRMTESKYAKAFIASDAPEETFRTGIADGTTFFAGASAAALRSALNNHRRMKEDVEHGAIGAEELDKAIAQGTALSEEALDKAVCKTLEFVGSIAGRERTRSARAQDEQIKTALSAARESIVMIKNADGALPVSHKIKLATVGERICDVSDVKGVAQRQCAAHGGIYVGHADGYKAAAERSDELIPDAVALAQRSDVVLVFVGHGKQRGEKFTGGDTLALPANQAALLDALVKTGKKIIAATVGNVLPSMDFVDAVAGAFVLPTGGAQTARALFELLFGDVSPSGRLTATAYFAADEYFGKQRSDVAAGRYKIGEFIGYRRYTTENVKVGYPFGHGLTYGKFVYSNLKTLVDSVEVTVKNVGTRTAAEVAQLYVGKKDSVVVRPARELKGFAKVEVEPGRSVQIKFPINAAMLEIFDPASGKRRTENGVYDLYIGASADDIRLTGAITVNGENLTSGGDKLADYLPSVSNILSNGYRMSALTGENASGAFKSARPSDGSASLEKLFADEFGEQFDDEPDELDRDDEMLEYSDDTVTVKTIADGFAAYALANGIKTDGATAYELFAAFAASRVVLLRCGKSEFDTLVTLLSGYFSCPQGIDDASDYNGHDDIFGGGTSALVGAAEFAAQHRDRVTVAAFDNVRAHMLGKIFTPFIRYATLPDDIKVFYGENKRELDFPNNVWFVMRLADEKCSVPAYVADMATVVFPKLSIVRPTDSNTRIAAPDRYRFVAACRRAERNYELDEDQWKKIDRLERFVSSRAPFVIGNKLCVQTEKFIAVLLECGVEPLDVLDRTVAAKLVPHAATALDGKLTSDDGGLITVLCGIFGDDDTARIKAAVRGMSALKEGV